MLKNKKNNKSKNKKDKNLLRVVATQNFTPIIDVRDGIIITRDSNGITNYIKILEFSPINFSLRSPSEQAMIVEMFGAILRNMPEILQFKVISRKADSVDHIRDIENFMANEENPRCRILQKEQINLISELSIAQGISRRFLVAFRYKPTGKNANRKPEWSEIVNTLNFTANQIKIGLQRIGNELHSEDNSDTYTLSLLYDLLCRRQSQRVPFLEHVDSVLQRYRAAGINTNIEGINIPVSNFISPGKIDVRNSRYMVVDGTYYAFAYVPSQCYPDYLPAGWLAFFINMGEGIDVDFFLKKEDAVATQTKLMYAIRATKVDSNTASDSDMGYDQMQNRLASAYYLRSALTKGDNFCYMSTLLTITATSQMELEERCERIKSQAISWEIDLRFCNFMHEEAFLSALPICNLYKPIYNAARRNIPSGDAASAYPFISGEITEKGGVLFGINQASNSLVFMAPFNRILHMSGNMTISGGTGSGKTYTLQVIAMRLRQQNTQVFIIAPDKGTEFKRATAEIGGTYIHLIPGSSHSINIMEIRKRKFADLGEDFTNVAEQSMLASKCIQLRTFFTMLVQSADSNQKLSIQDRELIDKAAIATYKKFGISMDNSSLLTDPNDPESPYKPMPVLGDLQKTLYEMETADGGKPNLALYINSFVSGSAANFNQKTNVDLNNMYVVLDVSGIDKAMLDVVMFIVMDYVWDIVRQDTISRKAILIDELWELTRSNSPAADFVVQIYKLIRAYNGIAIGATQDLGDFLTSTDAATGQAILNNSMLSFIMRIKNHSEAAVIAKAFHLPEGVISQACKFERGTGLLISGSEQAIVKVRATGTEHNCITTDASDLERLVAQK